MKLEKIDNEKRRRIKDTLSEQMMSHPLMMFYCPEKSKREKFINDYLDYYLCSWVKYGEAYLDDDGKVLASLVSTGAFEYKFSGKHAVKMKLNKNSYRIFIHRESVENITSIIVPENIEARVLNIYGFYNESRNEAESLVDEIMTHARERGFALVYETFSRRFIPFMQGKGFEIAYQKQFLDTQFVQTVMTYNI